MKRKRTGHPTIYVTQCNTNYETQCEIKAVGNTLCQSMIVKIFFNYCRLTSSLFNKLKFLTIVNAGY